MLQGCFHHFIEFGAPCKWGPYAGIHQGMHRPSRAILHWAQRCLGGSGLRLFGRPPPVCTLASRRVTLIDPSTEAKQRSDTDSIVFLISLSTRG